MFAAAGAGRTDARSSTSRRTGELRQHIESVKQAIDAIAATGCVGAAV